MPVPQAKSPATFVPDSAAAWRRLGLVLLIATVGSVGMWSVVVVLPIVQEEFAATRADVSLAFTMTMIGFGVGGVFTGRLSDKLGILPAIAIGTSALFCGYVGAGFATALWQFTLHPRADRSRRVGHVRAADGGGVALVRAAARHRGDDRRQRQLSSPARSGRRSSSAARRCTAGARRTSPSACSVPAAMALLL